MKPSRLPAARSALNFALVGSTLVLFAWLQSVTGVIEAGDGRGYDGGAYASMLEEGWDRGTANTALRPLILLLNTPVFVLTGDAVASFRWMNYLYVGALCLGLCLLFDCYSRDMTAKVLFIANVFLCIATLKYIAYYPVLVDAGAYAALTLTAYFIVSGKRISASVWSIAAALSREFSVAVLILGAMRDLRLRVPLRTTALTYLPAIAAFIAWRALVMSYSGASDGGVVTVRTLFAYLEHWRQPLFVAFFLYFLVTVFGGVSLLVVARPGLVAGHLGREPEWALFIMAIVGVAAVGGSDIWRYLAYLLPAFTVLFAAVTRELRWPRHLALAAIVCLATTLTQRPWQSMNLSAYFRDWFPYYVHLETLPAGVPPPELWPLWGWRFIGAVVLLWLLGGLAGRREG
jgi:hypothetical protein